MKLLATILVLFAVGCDEASHASSGRLSNLPVSVAGNGIARGSVRFTGVAPVMKPIISTEKCCKGEPQLFEETVVVNPNGTLKNVFVYIEGAPQTNGSSQPAALLDQVRCAYVPHALGMQAGQQLNVRSSDPTMHNVHYTPQLNRARNLAMTSAGAQVAVRFDHAEFVRMKCDVHPWMTAWVGVFENSFFAVTQNDGAFEIKGIPAGQYKLVAWHELYGRQEQSINIVDERPVEVEFTVGRQS